MFEIAIEILKNTVIPSAILLIGLSLLNKLLSQEVMPKISFLFTSVLIFWTYSKIIGRVAWPLMETVHALPYLFVISGFLSWIEGKTQKAFVATWFLPLNIGLYYALYPLIDSNAKSLTIQLLLMNSLLVLFLFLEKKRESKVSITIAVLSALFGPLVILEGSTLIGMVFILNGGIHLSYLIFLRIQKIERTTFFNKIGFIFLILLLTDFYNYVL